MNRPNEGDEGMEQQHAAAEILQEVDRLEGRSMAAVRGFWTPAAVWGVLATLSIVPAAIGGLDVYKRMGWYWAVAAPVGLLVSYLLYRAQRVHQRPSGPSWRAILAVLAVLALTPIGAAALFLAASTTSVTAVFLLVAVGSGLVGWLVGPRTLGRISIPLFGLAAVSKLFISHSPLVLALSFAAGYLGAAAIAKWRRA